jgi:hypothetical protein
LFIGATLTATSIGITARVLSDLGRLNLRESQIVVAAAIFDDIVGLILLSILVTLASAGVVSIFAILETVVLAIAFVVGSIIIGTRGRMRILPLVQNMRVRGVLLVFAFSLALALAYGAALIGLATIIGDLRLTLHDRADLGGVTIVHGHEEVSTLHPIVMGHEHPAVKLKDDLGAVVSVPAFLVTDRLIVLPAFSPLALGVDVSAYPYLSPILNRTPIDDARVIGVDEREGLLDFGVSETSRESAAHS